ncbi:MAG: hypothetical protein ACLUOI_07835 [Eisenbergiella sp.]
MRQIHGDAAKLKWKIPPVVFTAIDNIIQKHLFITFRKGEQNPQKEQEAYSVCLRRRLQSHARVKAALKPNREKQM